MPKRNYSSTTVVRQLAAAMSSSTSGAVGTMVLDSTATVPTSYPFTMVIDPDTTSEEIVTVTGAPTGASYPITRGSDGTSPTAHLNNSYVRHMVTARDLQEPQDHIYASANVHGLAVGSSVVGTTDTQELTNKTINGGVLKNTINGATGVISGATLLNGSISGTLNNAAGTISNGTIDTATVTNASIAGSTINGGTLIGSITNSGTIAGGTYTTPTITSIKNAAGTAYITDTDLNFTVGSNGSIINKSYFYQLGTANTNFVSTTINAQSIFGKALTLPETGPTNTLYHFEAKFRLINGTASHSVYFQLGALGTGTISACDLTLWASDVAGVPANASVGVTNITSGTSTQEIITSSVTGGTYVTVIGTFAATSGATLNPGIKFSVAPGTPVSVAANAYVKVTPIAAWTSGAATSRGTWA